MKYVVLAINARWIIFLMLVMKFNKEVNFALYSNKNETSKSTTQVSLAKEKTSSAQKKDTLKERNEEETKSDEVYSVHYGNYPK